MSEQFDFDKALAALQNGQDLTGKDGILPPILYPWLRSPLTQCR